MGGWGWYVCYACVVVVWLVLWMSFGLFNIVLGALRHRLQLPPPKLSKGGGGSDLLSTQDLASEVDAQHDRNKHQQRSEDDECI